MTDARRERAELCDLLARLGPDQPTLCEGWRTRDLAVHLLVRERHPMAATGIALRPLAGVTDRASRALAARPFDELVALIRQPPRWSPLRFGPIDSSFNGMEYFIHHEDVRRAQPDWQPRPLSASLAAALWSRARLLARLRLRRFPAALEVTAPGHGTLRTGRGGERVTLSADPGELALFLTGRQRAARVELTGPAELTDQLTATQLAL